LADDNRYRRDRTSINAVAVDLVIVNNDRLTDVMISYRPLKLAPALGYTASGIGQCGNRRGNGYSGGSRP